MAHLVITIGCEYGAKGNMIGRKVAKDLGIKFYDVIRLIRLSRKLVFLKTSWKR